MAGEDQKERDKAQAGGATARRLDRREVLKGLSTVPALGLFGYAWNRQREYRDARAEAAAAAPAAGNGVQAVNVAYRRSTSRSSAPVRRARC